MSVKVMHWVFEESQSRGNTRLVLLAIADWAGDNGGDAWPSLTSIADKARVSRRTAIRCVEELVHMGELTRTHGGGKRGQGGVSNGYRILMKQCQPVTTSEATSGDTHGTSDNVALVPSEHEVVTNTTRSGDTRGTRSVISVRSVRGSTKRKTGAPSSLPITDAMVDWSRAKAITVDIEAETDKMLDYHRGKGNQHVDWVAAWRTWMRNAQKFHIRDNPASGRRDVNGFVER